jgi:hypothetical protein
MIVEKRRLWNEGNKKINYVMYLQDNSEQIEDELCFVGQGLRFCEKLSRYEVPFEIHVFDSGVHGMSLATVQASGDPIYNSDTVSEWKRLSQGFLSRHL